MFVNEPPRIAAATTSIQRRGLFVARTRRCVILEEHTALVQSAPNPRKRGFANWWLVDMTTWKCNCPSYLHRPIPKGRCQHIWGVIYTVAPQFAYDVDEEGQDR